MPKHYAVNENIVKGTASFNNTKTAIIYFKRENGSQVYFSKKPYVSLTITDTNTQPAARVAWIKEENLFIGCKIKFTSKETLEVDWSVQE